MIPFWKYEGLGNDLVFFRGGPETFMSPGWIARVCDRHLGVGADGIMCVEHTPESQDLAIIHYMNADGSAAEMCGNGLRCAVLFLGHEGRATSGEEFSVEMKGSGRKRCVYRGDDDIEVEIGSPERGRGAEGEPERIRLDVEGTGVEIVPLTVGNPHAVIFGKRPRAQMEVLGPSLEGNRLFPDRVNVEFAHVREPNAIDLVVWERGCGFTQACGSGACAAAAAAVWEGLCDPDVQVVVKLPGGTLRVRLDATENVLWLSGPARRVFSGTLEPGSFGS